MRTNPERKTKRKDSLSLTNVDLMELKEQFPKLSSWNVKRRHENKFKKKKERAK